MNLFQTLLMRDRIYKSDEITGMIQDSVPDPDFKIKRKYRKKSIGYANIPCAFDTETTSFLDSDGNERATMYAWALGINGSVMIGRTWTEMQYTFKALTDYFRLRDSKRFIIYVHNLSFDFQFFRHYFNYIDVFAVKPLTPIYAVTDTGIEFRDSYILSALSLEKTGQNLLKYKMEKKVGDLNYKLYRHSKTPLKEKEIGYIANDVRVDMAYIQECIEEEGDITKIPLTNTGRVRVYCRSICFSDKRHRYYYSQKIKNLTLTVQEYKQLRNGFQGGFTHPNPYEVGKIIKDVGSFDFISAYPGAMLSEMYPMSSPEHIDILDVKILEESLKYYCCVFDVKFTNLRPKIFTENYLSFAKSRNAKNCTTTNGRVVTADLIETTITNVDFEILKDFYKWDKCEISNFMRFRKGYLPKEIFIAVLNLYKGKTELKNIEGKEAEYLKNKGMLNSTFGMAVTSIMRDVISYGLDWIINPPNEQEVIENYNTDFNRFLYYPWGVFICAYCRRSLFTAIKACGSDYIYSDTDSVKVRNYKKYLPYFNSFNSWISKRLEKALEYHKLDKSLLRPKTKEGKEKMLGLWDFEGFYDRFKTLGAKRYMTEKDGKISITVSGLNKKIAVPYILLNQKQDPFEFFKEGMYIPKGFTGKNIHKYINEETQGTITDYLGVTAEYHEQSSVYLTESDYSLSLSENMAESFVNFITDLLMNYRSFAG